MFDLSVFSSRLNELMLENGVTSIQLAKSSDVAVQTVNCWRRGIKAMKLTNLIKVSNALHCTIDYLVGRNESVLDFSPKDCSGFYLRLRLIMQEKKISWSKLVKETPIKDSYLYLWKKGSDVKIPALITLADYFDISIDYLVGRDE